MGHAHVRRRIRALPVRGDRRVLDDDVGAAAEVQRHAAGITNRNEGGDRLFAFGCLETDADGHAVRVAGERDVEAGDVAARRLGGVEYTLHRVHAAAVVEAEADARAPIVLTAGRGTRDAHAGARSAGLVRRLVRCTGGAVAHQALRGVRVGVPVEGALDPAGVAGLVDPAVAVDRDDALVRIGAHHRAGAGGGTARVAAPIAGGGGAALGVVRAAAALGVVRVAAALGVVRVAAALGVIGTGSTVTGVLRRAARRGVRLPAVAAVVGLTAVAVGRRRT